MLKRKKSGIRCDKAIVFAASLIFGMQLTGLISLAVSADLPEGYDEGEAAYAYFSYDALLDLNDEDNIIVFITDTLDGEYMKLALREYPEMYEMLDGFTYYSNYVSEFRQTFPAVTTMLTGHYYDYGAGLTFTEYWNEAWAQRTPIDILREHGYSTNLYLDRLSTYNNMNQIRDKTDNIAFAGSLRVDFQNMITTVSRLTLGRLSPYFLKELFLSKIDSSFANNMFYLDIDAYPDYSRPIVSWTYDLEFYHYIKNNAVTVKSEKKVFNLIHLNFAHETNLRYDTDNETVINDDGNAYITATVRGGFEIINAYMGKMKELSVYDNSVVIIVSDHGRDHGDDGRSISTLLIKPRNSRGVMQEDSKTQLSGKYFPASLLDAAGILHHDFGISYFDIIEGKVKSPPRYFYLQNDYFFERFGTEMGNLFATYLIPDDASDLDNWRLVGD
ncbi:MAG: sulfatase-like hydrolase/transferase [Oscillospiraceae bacterium]|nr:sulfatase-like hydrolase/transferase [Oscillospiraceae bacterium]